MSSMQRSARSVSVELPAGTSDRLQAAAEARGQTVQRLVESLVERFLTEDAIAAPNLADVVEILRANARHLNDRGIAALWVFGSVARGDAKPGSDVDLLAEFAPAKRLSLVGLASLRAEMSDLLGAPADLVERDALRPPVRPAAEREAVRVL